MNLIVAGPDVQDPLFTLDLSGRVRNLSLPAASSALVPLFEAVSNSIHAVEARFPDRSVQDGSITITLVRANDNESELQGFVVQDNGTGLTEENMKSFLTSDSPYKQRRGGEGDRTPHMAQNASELRNYEHVRSGWRPAKKNIYILTPAIQSD